MKKYDAVLFDLDGTLLYTLPDMADSLNHALRQNGCGERTLSEVRSFIGNGVKRLVERSLPGGAAHPAFEAVWAEYKRYYSLHREDTTSVYPGVRELLAALKAGGTALAVVTNKPQPDAEPMVRRFFGGLVDVTEGKRSGRATKPAPDALFSALTQLGVSPGRAVYVGDSEVDLETAKNAGTDCVLVTWGYRDREQLELCGAAGRIDVPAELLRYME